MLTPTVRPYVAAVLSISTLLVSCNTTVTTFDTLLKHRSDTQILVVKNELPQTVVLISDSESVPDHQLPQGEAKEIRFVVFTTMHLQSPDNRYWLQAQAETEDNLIEESGERGFLSTEADVTLSIRLSDTDFRKYLLLFEDCWFDTAGPRRTHELIITGNEANYVREVELCP